MKIYLKLCIPLLLVTMACAFVQGMLFPPSPTPDLPTPSQAPSPTATATPTAEPPTCDDECLSICLDHLETVLGTEPLEPIGNDIYEKEGAEFNLVTYEVTGDEIGDPYIFHVPSEYQKYQKDTEAHRRIWDFYAAVIPPELRVTIKTFAIFTDGPREKTAWVRRTSAGDDYSEMGFDLLDADYPPVLADTLVHETAHLIMLNGSQVIYDETHPHYYQEEKQSFFACEQFVSDGGCSLPSSYINLFYQEFWKDSYAEWWQVNKKAEEADSFEEYWEVIDEYYDEHDDRFINSYAASDVEEDMAESFAFFVLHPKPTVKWIYEKKVDFYYDFPELVEYRRQMIQGLCSYIK